MIVDVNVLLADFYTEHPHHERAVRALDGVKSPEIPAAVLVGFVRLASLPRLWRRPAPAAATRRYADGLLPMSLGVGPASRGRFTRLCEQMDLSGNDVPDAWLAALAIERGLPLLSFDQGFARFDGLDWRTP